MFPVGLGTFCPVTCQAAWPAQMCAEARQFSRIPELSVWHCDCTSTCMQIAMPPPSANSAGFAGPSPATPQSGPSFRALLELGTDAIPTTVSVTAVEPTSSRAKQAEHKKPQAGAVVNSGFAFAPHLQSAPVQTQPANPGGWSAAGIVLTAPDHRSASGTPDSRTPTEAVATSSDTLTSDSRTNPVQPQNTGWSAGTIAIKEKASVVLSAATPATLPDLAFIPSDSDEAPASDDRLQLKPATESNADLSTPEAPRMPATVPAPQPEVYALTQPSPTPQLSDPFLMLGVSPAHSAPMVGKQGPSQVKGAQPREEAQPDHSFDPTSAPAEPQQSGGTVPMSAVSGGQLPALNGNLAIAFRKTTLQSTTARKSPEQIVPVTASTTAPSQAATPSADPVQQTGSLDQDATNSDIVSAGQGKMVKPMLPNALPGSERHASDGALSNAADPGLQRQTSFSPTTSVQQISSAPSPSPMLHTAATAMPSVTPAGLVQAMSRSEMQVHLHGEEFGRISIHTAYGRDSLAAEISVENAQLGAALSAHLPAVEQKLSQDHGLHASVTIGTQSDTTSSSNREGTADTNSRQGRSSYPGATQSINRSLQDDAAAVPPATLIYPADPSRLDIHI